MITWYFGQQYNSLFNYRQRGLSSIYVCTPVLVILMGLQLIYFINTHIELVYDTMGQGYHA